MMKSILPLLVVAVCTLSTGVRAQLVDSGKLIQKFSETVRTDGAQFQVILLNDRTIEALFPTSPAKAAFRSKARMTTVFFVQGTATKNFTFKPEVTVTQKGETLEGKNSGMKNFAGGPVAKGDLVQGLVELPKKLDLYEPFKFAITGSSVEFRLNNDDVRELGNR